MAAGFDLDDAIRKVPDFPKKGILFYDITSILTNPDAFRFCVDSMARIYGNKDLQRSPPSSPAASSSPLRSATGWASPLSSCARRASFPARRARENTSSSTARPR